MRRLIPCMLVAMLVACAGDASEDELRLASGLNLPDTPEKMARRLEDAQQRGDCDLVHMGWKAFALAARPAMPLSSKMLLNYLSAGGDKTVDYRPYLPTSLGTRLWREVVDDPSIDEQLQRVAQAAARLLQPDQLDQSWHPIAVPASAFDDGAQGPGHLVCADYHRKQQVGAINRSDLGASLHCFQLRVDAAARRIKTLMGLGQPRVELALSLMLHDVYDWTEYDNYQVDFQMHWLDVHCGMAAPFNIDGVTAPQARFYRLSCTGNDGCSTGDEPAWKRVTLGN